MADVIFQIYGTFVLTLAGFVLPIIVIALSAFPDGISTLKEGYENEKKQAQNNLEQELKKEKEGDVDVKLLKININKLKISQQKAKTRLRYLSPNYILLRSALSILISLLSFLLGLLFFEKPIYIFIIFLSVSIGSLIWAIVIFYNSITVIIEASTAVQATRKAAEEKTLELLTLIADNSKKENVKDNNSLFIEPTKIKINFNNIVITDGIEYAFSVNNKHTIKISFTNSSDYMLKTAELGFIFPADFIVEGATIDSTYTSDTKKIIRFKHEHLQANSTQGEGNIDITFLKTGIYEIDCFVKGENLKTKREPFKIKVVE